MHVSTTQTESTVCLPSPVIGDSQTKKTQIHFLLWIEINTITTNMVNLFLLSLLLIQLLTLNIT